MGRLSIATIIADHRMIKIQLGITIMVGFVSRLESIRNYINLSWLKSQMCMWIE